MIIKSEFVDLPTPTGIMRTYVHRPKSESTFPTILFYSEIFQQTGPIERAAKIMASHGFVVLVPEVFHELNEIGTVLNYDDAGRDKGNADKSEKNVQAYDTDNQAMIDWVGKQKWTNGHVGAMGFCIGGHLAFRAALNPSVKATACFYATDIHKRSLGAGMNDDSLDRFGDIKGELLMIWGRQDPHVSLEGRRLIRTTLEDADVNFQWHEFNGAHAFVRDEGVRYDPVLAMQGFGLSLEMFGRCLR